MRVLTPRHPHSTRFTIIGQAASIVALVLGLASCGGGGGGTPPPPGATSSARFAYVANRDNNTLSMYAVDGTTGQFHYTGYIAAGTNPVSVTVDPTGKFAYAANNSSNDVSVYTINPATGELTAVGLPVAAGTNPRSVTTSGGMQ